ncbi:hypothetical protein ACFCY8_26400 [Streptomyces noursei]|uniref:hypothetical protein n=1 Tax=Streptomyces noursei TaxID=1971 RepID=UPI0035E26E7C
MTDPPVSRDLVTRVWPDYFEIGDHQDAMAIGADFVNAFRRLGVDFTNIGIAQQGDSRDYEYGIDLGFIDTDEAKDATQKVNALMDELQAFREKTAGERAALDSDSPS